LGCHKIIVYKELGKSNFSEKHITRITGIDMNMKALISAKKILLDKKNEK